MEHGVSADSFTYACHIKKSNVIGMWGVYDLFFCDSGCECVEGQVPASGRHCQFPDCYLWRSSGTWTEGEIP